MPMDMPDTPNVTTAASAAGRGTYPEHWLRVWSHREDLLRVARRGSMTPEDAEDAVHEAMLRAAERPGLDDERLGGWLTTVTMRLCVDRHRQVTREAEVHRSPTLTVPGPVPVEEAVCDRDEARWLAARSAQLPARQAEALRLKSEGLDVSEVALEMRLGYRTVESLLARARRTLRTTLAGTLGLALFLWGRGKLLASGPAQAVAVSSATVGLVVAGFVVPATVGHGATVPPAESRGAGAPVGYVRPVGSSVPGGGGGVRDRARGDRGSGVVPGVRREAGAARLRSVVPLRLTLALPLSLRLPLPLPPVVLLGIAVARPALPPPPRGSAPDPAAQSPQGLNFAHPTPGPNGDNPPPGLDGGVRPHRPASAPSPRKKSVSDATDRVRLPVEQVSEVCRRGRRGTGWVRRSGSKGLPCPSVGKWSGAMSR
ncbi:RNA polymerase sigma factor [Streptomyces fractus]|uniref:RNA polymerase sigma factor n=1 Tax=Streptomyces fractus TaxID=641806 RepID=UPI003CEF4184